MEIIIVVVVVIIGGGGGGDVQNYIVYIGKSSL
jgi:hypothetical protein